MTNLTKKPPFLSLVIPVYNERESLESLLLQCLSLKEVFAKNLEIIFVDDGSRDGSKNWIMETEKKHPDVRGVYHPKNLGIGMALTSGYEKAMGDWVGLLPADLQFNPADLAKAIPYLNRADIICFYRPIRDDYSPYRHFVSKMNQKINRRFFDLSVRDVNWVKIWRRWVIKDIHVSSRTPFIESERLILAKRMGAQIVEVEAPYYPRSAGIAKGARIKTVVRSLFDLLKFIFATKKGG